MNLHFGSLLFNADESEVVGLCGLHRDYETTGDKIDKRRRYPWLAFVHQVVQFINQLTIQRVYIIEQKIIKKCNIYIFENYVMK